MTNAYGASKYRQTDVLNATPVHLVVMAYDLAITACEKQNMETSIKAISALRDALDYDYPEVAGGLLSLYNYCLESIRGGDYDSAKHVMTELRDAWVTVEKRLNTSTAIIVEEIGQNSTEAAA
jgi:flagellin-specific chaperone FliS